MEPEVNITEAAILVGMSPQLLRWLSSYAPKSFSTKKLPIARKVGPVTFYKTAELIEFNAWLAEPWPAKLGERPHIPTKIREEIIQEAAAQCAFCHTHADTCEAAHIDPISQSKNNHPHNLIWLCANHHTSYDKGLIGPKAGTENFVKNLKAILLGYSKIVYEVKAEAATEAFHLLEVCRRAASLNPTTPEQIASTEYIGEDVLAKLVGISNGTAKNPGTKKGKSIQAFLKLGNLLSSEKLAASLPVKSRLEAVTAVREDFRLAAGLKVCPLCAGSRLRNGDECAFCGGEGSVTAKAEENFDPREFEVVNCPLCDGNGRHEGESCPVCQGECQMERRFAEAVDINDFDQVDCPLCTGTGRSGSHDCEICHGDCRIPRRVAEAVEIRDFDSVECPLCQGSGRSDEGDDCPLCVGECTVSRRLSATVDLSIFDKVDCPLCDGTGQSEWGDCSYCGGEGIVSKGHAEQFDPAEYELAECPICEGTGSNDEGDCEICEGGGQVTKVLANRLRRRR
ncbi:HNH endonuclease [Janthinobacterium sp. PC23-8]|uniref:HNH endonuclease n=1 Tax=Janthinobacterium sp. PC23-8 TaxID=2012679 RepID=UPI000B977929|nr:HNH endonuclease signature motif containing protein [Janthinobacterium sp. PC23-8]OYO31342.1 hypothetical protein CD932_09580 [Janthinobacterium sp. PC23-8]